MIQTLVENGIKHGIANLKEGGSIEIKTREKNNKLQIEIRNSGQFLSGGFINGGYGLLNTKKRLQLIFGDEASFSINNENQETVLTMIEVPKSI